MREATSRALALVLALATAGCGEHEQPAPAAPAAPASRDAAAATEASPSAASPLQAEPALSPEDAETLRAAEALAAQLGIPHPAVVLEVEGYGRIRIELLPEKAPKTAANFASLAEKGFYDGTTFHRVIPGFVIQGGDPNSKNRDPRDDGEGGPGYTIPDEPSDLRQVRGTVSMANLGSPHTAGSQFFIVLADQPDLDGRYTAFGRVTEGMDVVDRIAAVETDRYGRWGAQDRPRTNVVVKRAQLVDDTSPDERTPAEPTGSTEAKERAPAPDLQAPATPAPGP